MTWMQQLERHEEGHLATPCWLTKNIY